MHTPTARGPALSRCDSHKHAADITRPRQYANLLIPVPGLSADGFRCLNPYPVALSMGAMTRMKIPS